MDVKHRSVTPRGWARAALHAVALGVAVLSLARCGNPPASASITSPTAVQASLTIAGNLVFTAAGQTSQLTAIAGDGTVVTSGVTWTSLQPGVVSVTSTGLATAVSFGTAPIHATTASGSGTVQVVVANTPVSAKTLSACQAITAPGNYVLGADVANTGTCVQIAATALVQLDCQGHTASSLSISGSHGVTVSNCVIPGSLSIATSDTTALTNVTASGSVSISFASAITIRQSTLRPKSTEHVAAVTVFQGTNVQFVQDTIPAGQGFYAFYFANGTGNQVRQCVIDGAYDGSANDVGSDDAVLLINEVGDTVQGNTITNFFDTAVEGVDVLANTLIADNTMTNLGATAIGSYWCTNWTNNIVRNNTASQAPALVYVYYAQGLSQCGASSLPPAFTGNQIVGNKFRTPVVGTQPTLPGVSRSVPTSGPASRLIVQMVLGPSSGNLIQGNDLGTNDGPLLLPLSGFSNGGGNTCGPLNAAVSNFACGGT
jgi:hypothetical protein